jgi:SNF2 family DNA or RNA helicase
MDLFCRESEIKSNFIKFASLTPLIDGCNIIDYLNIILKITYDEWNNEYLTICQILDNNDIIIFAKFYNYYNYTQGLKDLIKNKYLHDFFKININFNNLPDKVKLFIDIYIDKLYLLDIYENNIELPNLVYRIIIDNSMNHKKPFSSINYPNTSLYSQQMYNLQTKRKFYIHQKKNINWMIDIEKKIDNNCLNFHYHNFDKIECVAKYHIETIKEDIYLDIQNKKLYDIQKIPINILNVKGGILCDEVGLGKTLSMIGLIANDCSSKNTTLVICPRRICRQWGEEIEKTLDLKFLIVHSIKQIKLLDYNNINDYDIVIVPYSLFNNKNYIEISNNKKKFSIERYNWHRIILDESHEYICKTNKNSIKTIRERINILISKYRWLCSGTPLNNFCDLVYIMEYLLYEGKKQITINTDLEKRYDIIRLNQKKVSNSLYIWQEIVSCLFKRSTKKDTISEISIPQPKLETEFLDQTIIEQAIYDSALGDKRKMIELCNHILVSDHHIQILGNKPISLTDAHEKMTKYYLLKIKRIQKQIEKLEKMMSNPKLEGNKEVLKIKIEENQKELSCSRSKYSIFNNLSTNLENQKCPICLESINNLTKVITDCGHFFCSRCLSESILKYNNHKCPMCRENIKEENLRVILPNEMNLKQNKWGTKMAKMISYIENVLLDNNNRIIIFSQFDNMLKLISKVLDESNIGYLILNGSFNVINSRIKKFKLDLSIRIVLLSSDKAASGLNLTEANHIILLDTHNAENGLCSLIEEQAIGRSVRIGQKSEVIVKRFVMKNTIEEENFRKNVKII